MQRVVIIDYIFLNILLLRRSAVKKHLIYVENYVFNICY